MNLPIAIVCSDLHLCERAPVARSAEPDWFEAMLRPIRQLNQLVLKHKVPVICAGDVFDYWKSSPEVINFALHELPDMYAIPGQHDLPMHLMRDMDKSAFGTLVETGKIKLLGYMQPEPIEGAYLWGYHWGAEIRPPSRMWNDRLNVAVIHAFVWVNDYGFPGAPEKARASVFREKLNNFDVLLFGDNHKQFYLEGTKSPTVFNHGGFMRRKINEEREMKPAFGLLMQDGTVERIPQDVSQDLFLDAREKVVFEEEERFLEDFLRELGDLGQTRLDFVEAVKHYLDSRDISEGAKKLILQAIHQ